MLVNGYDESKPITIWREHNIVIDGHVRLRAAQNIGLKSVPVVELDFEDEHSALEYAIHNQRDRRKLDDPIILHLIKKFDKVYPRGGDRKSKFANQNFENQESEIKESESETESREKPMSAKERRALLRNTSIKLSSRDETAKLLGISEDKVSKCRHVLKNCSDSEKKAIMNGDKTIHQVYKSSLDAVKKQKRKLKEAEINRKRLEELKTKKFFRSHKKADLARYGKIVEMLDFLTTKLFPALYKHSSDMKKIMDIVEFFKSDSLDFEEFCKEPPVQRFLGSLLVTDFIEMLRCFGYKIATPKALNVTKEERPVKKKRPAPKPHCNIERVHRPDFISNADRRAMEQRIEESMDWQNMQHGS